jgi:hypothetical protein
MGFALAESQSPPLRGVLTLHVVRNGSPLNIKLNLGDSTPYADTWPYNCSKTKRVRAAALKAVMDDRGSGKSLFGLHHGGGFWTMLFLMASGDKAAMDRVRDEMRRTTKPASEYPKVVTGGRSWLAGYELLNVAEYYLLTRDRAVRPRIQHLVRVLEAIQFPSGGWSHGGPPGYGEINNAGLACFVALILARECGAELNMKKFTKSIRYFGQYCGTNFPYGLATTATFFCVLFPPLVGKEVIHRLQQERTKPATVTIGMPHNVLVQQTREKSLSQILCVVALMAASPDISVKRKPVCFTKLSERRFGGIGVLFARRDHDAPMRGRELAS